VGGAVVNTLAVVVGVGARTSAGLTARHTAFLLRAGAVGLRDSPLLDIDDQPVTFGRVPTLDPTMIGADRVRALAVAAAGEALVAAGEVATGLRVKIVVGLDVHLGRHAPGGSSAADDIGRALRDSVAGRVASATFEAIARGEAASALKLDAACAELAAGQVDLVLLGGAHSDYDPAIVLGLSSEGRLFGPEKINGVLPGESAGFLLLANPVFARRAGLPARARLHSVGNGFEKARPDNDEPSFEARGLTVAVHAAAAAMESGKLRAGWALTDMTAEAHRVNEWQAMFVRTQRYWCEPQCVDALAHKLGRLGAAAMPVQVALAATAWRHGFAPHPIAISMVGSDTGERAATVWSAPPPPSA
jgi:3-oxoacyl-[acyl-carrier-protein] synthase I